MKGAELECTSIWIGRVNADNGTATGEVIKEQGKVLGHRMRVANCVYKNWYFVSRNEIIVKMNSLKNCTTDRVYKLRYVLRDSALSFILKILSTVFRTPYDTLIHPKIAKDIQFIATSALISILVADNVKIYGIRLY
jgi:hypothetical protein